MLVKCESKSCRVKGISFHPHQSWVLVSLHNGAIQLWDYRLGCLIDTFEEHKGPVRGLDFHLSQSLFCSGGDDYLIKVWDYKCRKSLFSVSGHHDYVRTVEFHRVYPWICSASDDQTVRITNWQSRSTLAVLTGHHHYVMCATFHPSEPDLLASVSLDQTCRLWDLSGLREKTVSNASFQLSGGSPPAGGTGTGLSTWGSGTGIASALGSASGLSLVGSGSGSTGGFGAGGSEAPSAPRITTPASADYYGTNDAVCKHILEGHERGINWVAFHPTQRLLATGSDDRLIRLWRFDDYKWWEEDTLRGHLSNVSSLAFHPLEDILISNSEDRTIRVWDLKKRSLIHSYRRESDRFWVLKCAPSSNLVGVGHDSGMVVFKLHRERPPASLFFSDTLQNYSALIYRRGQLFYVPRAGALITPHTHTNKAVAVTGGSPSATATATGGLLTPLNAIPLSSASADGDVDASAPVHSLIRNPFEQHTVTAAVLRSSKQDANLHFEIYATTVRLQVSGASAKSGGKPNSLVLSGACKSLAFCARGKLAFLTPDKKLLLFSTTAPSPSGPASTGSGSGTAAAFAALLATESSPAYLATLPLPEEIAECETENISLFTGPSADTLLIRGDEKVLILAIPTLKVVARLNLTIAGAHGAKGKIRRVVWNRAGTLVAFLSKHYVCLASNKLEHLASLHECIRLKSGCWSDDMAGGPKGSGASGGSDETRAFIYATVSHLKYLLPNGDSGIYLSIPERYDGLYIEAATGHTLFSFDRKANLKSLTFDRTEERLKAALCEKRYKDVATLMKSRKVPGHAWVGYLKRKGYSEVAYQCVPHSDHVSRAILATEFGDLEAAMDATIQLDHPDAWARLGSVAEKVGAVAVAEKAYQKANAYAALISLYMVTGNFASLTRFGNALLEMGDAPAAFHISLLTGDLEARFEMLMSSKQYALAYALAKQHGLPAEIKDRAESQLSTRTRERVDKELSQIARPKALIPPLPISLDQATSTWPLRELPEDEGARLARTGAFKDIYNKTPSLPDFVAGQNFAGSPAAPTAAASTDGMEWGNDALSHNFKGQGQGQGQKQGQETMKWTSDDEDEDDWGLIDEQDEVGGNRAGEISTETEGQTYMDSVSCGLEDGEGDAFGVGAGKGGSGLNRPLPKCGAGLVKRCYAWKSSPSITDLIVDGRVEEARKLVETNIGLGDDTLVERWIRHVRDSSFTLAPLFPSQIAPTGTLSGKPNPDQSLPLLRLPIWESSEECPVRYCDPKPRLRPLASVDSARNLYAQGVSAFATKDFEKARKAFYHLFACACLLTVNAGDKLEVRDVLDSAREYVLVMLMEESRLADSKQAEGEGEGGYGGSERGSDSAGKELKWRCLMAFRDLQPVHRFFLLREAVKHTFRAKSYISASLLVECAFNFAANHPALASAQATELERLRKVQMQCNVKGVELVQIDVDVALLKDDPKTCAMTLMPAGNKVGYTCSLCNAFAAEEFRHQTCRVCTIAKIGLKVPGVLPVSEDE